MKVPRVFATGVLLMAAICCAADEPPVGESSGNAADGVVDVRESPAVRIAALLVEEGAEVRAYDPEATAPGLTQVGSAIDAARDADVLLVATEWPEFAQIDLDEVRGVMRGHRVVDARNLLDPAAVRGAGLDYLGLGRPGA